MGRIYFDPKRPKPTPMEASSRFACGAAAGLFLGIVVSLSFFPWSLNWILSVTIVSTVACALLAVPYGEDFWRWMRNVLWFLHLS